MVVCTLDLRCEWERYSSIKANSQGYLICLIYFEVSESVLHHGCNFIASYLYRTSLANSNMMCAESIPPVIKCFATQIQRLVICLVSVLCLHVFTHGKPYGNCNSCGNPWQSMAIHSKKDRAEALQFANATETEPGIIVWSSTWIDRSTDRIIWTKERWMLRRKI